MAPLIALLVLFAVFGTAGQLGLAFFAGWLTPLRFALAGMFLLTASAHWGKRRVDLLRMVPPTLPQPALLITVTGLLEIAGAIGLLIPTLVHTAAVGLSLLLLVMFPANVYAAGSGATLDGRPVMPVLPRALLQFVFLGCTIAVALAARS
ncbi:MAG TPA: hypothetical protein VHL57_02820 [Flavobacteriales bacterium]|jgi:uncharacterized membrane protein|nr:hypothetical protein [Flavobacteriales bacterium]